MKNDFGFDRFLGQLENAKACWRGDVPVRSGDIDQRLIGGQDGLPPGALAETEPHFFGVIRIELSGEGQKCVAQGTLFHGRGADQCCDHVCFVGDGCCKRHLTGVEHVLSAPKYAQLLCFPWKEDKILGKFQISHGIQADWQDSF